MRVVPPPIKSHLDPTRTLAPPTRTELRSIARKRGYNTYLRNLSGETGTQAILRWASGCKTKRKSRAPGAETSNYHVIMRLPTEAYRLMNGRE